MTILVNNTTQSGITLILIGYTPMQAFWCGPGGGISQQNIPIGILAFILQNKFTTPLPLFL